MMKVVELLKIGRHILETLHQSCIKVSDIRFIDMYDEYVSLCDQKFKISYIAAVLSEKYEISERQFFYIIKRLQQGADALQHA